ncbi:MAG TPA: 5-formyltetrahydrofolate cyclo-ligase [Caulobacteraceae bacterium]|nr:5-formyltetrahydrofolate cyclo-ligase [Caulobacteraceae bacterium]
MVHASSASAKTLLRTALRGRRKALAAESLDAAERAAALFPLEQIAANRVVAGYRAQGREIDPGPLMRRLAAAGATLALPAAVDRDGLLGFRAYAEGDPLAPDAFGIAAPLAGAEALRPDLVIAPLLAFDRTGARIGQGGGHYDRTLAALRAEGSVFVLGLAYAGQEVAELPTEPHDQRLNAILTERAYIEVKKDL